MEGKVKQVKIMEKNTHSYNTEVEPLRRLNHTWLYNIIRCLQGV